ncbi:MAG: precorrin-6Y C5,15-methyltransferase (decarboxylating) subunit CbiT [Pseudomonadota bacterium]
MKNTAITPKIHIISCGIHNNISTQCQEIIAKAHVIFGARGLLADLGARYNPDAEHRTIAAHAKDNALEAIELARQGRSVVVLASGDALYHGFGGTLVNNLEYVRTQSVHDDVLISSLPELIFHPHITAFQELFHKLGMPWSDAKLFSVHSGIPQKSLPLRQLAENALCVVYAGSRFTAADIAKHMVSFLPESACRPAVLAEYLGRHDEKIVRGPLEDIARMACGPTSMLVLLPHHSCNALPLPLGLPEEQYERERNLITASDARAIILSRLRLPSHGLMWDIGAGSGSVGLEAASLRPELEVVAVERNAERSTMVDVNAQMLGITNHSCVTGEAKRTIHNLEGSPDRIFVGGGGDDLCAILDLCMERLAPNGFMLVSSVTMESFTALYHWQSPYRRDVTTISIAREAVIAGRYHHMRQQNSISLFTFSK